MLIVGAGGFAKEVADTIENESIVCFDDVNPENKQLLDRFPVLKDEEEVLSYFHENDQSFTLAVGNPEVRKGLAQRFERLGGHLISTIAEGAYIGKLDVTIGKGCNILHGAVISNSVTIGKGCIIYYNTIVTHDCQIGNFVELSPGACVLGGVTIGNNVQVGANATLLPKIKIGDNAVIAAGAVVTKDVPNNTLVAGIPATVKKSL